MERIQKLISAAGLMSRRAAEELISAGKVTVNGVTAQLGDKADPETDRILVEGRPLPRSERKVYLLLHKPRGYVTTLHDDKGRRNVIDLLPELDVRVYPVGRLDMDSEGLLILTNDGVLADRLMHPSHEVEKVYRTWVRGEDLKKAVSLLQQDMLIDGYKVRGALVRILRETSGGGTLDITIHEGRNRQVRKMCEQAGLRVTRLCRIQEGPIHLGGLKSGDWRFLTAQEVRALGGES